jgi:hypothetical protein
MAEYSTRESSQDGLELSLPEREQLSPPSATRRSDRIAIELPLQLSGCDIKNFAFLENSRTAVVSRHGAKIYSKYKMVRDQELIVCCTSTGKESEARIVGELGHDQSGYAYGIEFLDSSVNIWDIEFPPLSEADLVSGRTLLECVRCHTRELVYLDPMEVEVLATGLGLSRHCKLCTDMTIWKVARLSEVPPGPEPLVGARPPGQDNSRTQNERQDVRTGAKVSACIRHSFLGDEIVTTENISRGGMSFRSFNRFEVGARIEVALPYTHGGANIFTAARITHVTAEPGGKMFVYGASYVPIQKA